MDTSGPETLKDYLWAQLVTRHFSPLQEEILQFLLESLDSKGYFRDSLEEVASRFRIAEKEARWLLEQIQELEPDGVGARNLEIHESTVSRAVRQKYLQCSWGIFPLNYFFVRAAVDNGCDGSDAAGKGQSTRLDVKRVLAQLMEEKGFFISRRTVAKYRKELGIPGISGRKEY